jgi:hypothetical protein
MWSSIPKDNADAFIEAGLAYYEKPDTKIQKTYVHVEFILQHIRNMEEANYTKPGIGITLKQMPIKQIQKFVDWMRGYIDRNNRPPEERWKVEAIDEALGFYRYELENNDRPDYKILKNNALKIKKALDWLLPIYAKRQITKQLNLGGGWRRTNEIIFDDRF